MSNEYIFGKFKEKVDSDSSITLTDNIYKTPCFADFYNSVARETMNNDLEYYLSLFKEEDKILEIGTGNGRILCPLLEKNIDIYGIEPEEEMLSFLTQKERNRVKNIGIEQMETINDKYSHIIIPATSVSLFDENVFSKFLEDAQNLLLEGGKIILDFISPEMIEELSEKVRLYKIKNQFFLAGNFKKDNLFIYNIYTKTAQKEKIVGYSIKQIYSIERVNKISSKYGYEVNILQKSKDYVMLEVCKDGK